MQNRRLSDVIVSDGDGESRAMAVCELADKMFLRSRDSFEATLRDLAELPDDTPDFAVLSLAFRAGMARAFTAMTVGEVKIWKAKGE